MDPSDLLLLILLHDLADRFVVLLDELLKLLNFHVKSEEAVLQLRLLPPKLLKAEAVVLRDLPRVLLLSALIPRVLEPSRRDDYQVVPLVLHSVTLLF